MSINNIPNIIPIVNEEDLVFFRLVGDISYHPYEFGDEIVPKLTMKIGDIEASISPNNMYKLAPDGVNIVRITNGWELSFQFKDKSHPKVEDFIEIFNRFASRVNKITIDSLNLNEWTIDFSPFKGEEVNLKQIKGIEIHNLTCESLYAFSIPENQIKLVNCNVDKLIRL